MIDESLFQRDTFLLEESDPLTICVSFDRLDGSDPSKNIHELSPETLQKLNGGVPIWEDLPYGYSVTIYALSHNNVYLTVYEQVAETGFKKIEDVILNKFQPQHAGFLGEGEHRIVYCVFIKELGGLKRGIII